MDTVVLTGGGTAGHVTPNLALIPELQKRGLGVAYIGTEKGMERELIEPTGVPYHVISAGKLRRYLDMENLTDMAKILKGTFEARKILKKIRPGVVFSKGGFVSCPVVWAAWSLKIPVIIHESDMTPGLANRLSQKFAKKIAYTFPETGQHLPEGKGVLTGLPMRTALLSGSGEKGRELCGFHSEKPVLLVMGGSQGAGVLNDAIRENLHTLLEKYQICHLCGKGNRDNALQEEGYSQWEYAGEELPHLMQMSDLFLSRAGATAIHEMLLVGRPMVLVPLSKAASRGDQILNAASFKKRGFAEVIPEEELTGKRLSEALEQTFKNRGEMAGKMKKAEGVNGLSEVLDLILKEIN